MPVYEGKCHCGQVTWTADIDDERHIVCHCGACKVLGGGEYSLNSIIPKANLKFTKGEVSVYTYTGDSGTKVSCYYCPNCTAHPYHHQHVAGEDTIVARTTLLKGTDKWPRPKLEIYVGQRLKWQPETGEEGKDTT